MLANLYHSCMGHIFQPLETVGIEGVRMFHGDGIAFRCHPILTCVPTDYQEQVLITGVKTGLCPPCPIPPAMKLEEVEENTHYETCA